MSAAIEEIDRNQVEAVTATGARGDQVIAGGIGLQLNASIMNLAWTQVAVVLLAIIATVVVSEWVSAKARYAII